MELLLDRGVDVNAQGNEHYGYALQAACAKATKKLYSSCWSAAPISMRKVDTSVTPFRLLVIKDRWK